MGHVPSIVRFGLSTVIAVVLVLGASPSVDPGLAAANAAASCPEQVGHWPYGPSQAVAIDGDTAFFGVGTALRVADVSNQAEPVVLSEIPLGGVILDLEISDDLLIAAISRSGVAAVDISDPANPSLLDTLSFDEITGAVAIVDGHALIGGNSLSMVDLSVPSDLTVTGTLDDSIGRAYDLAVSGSMAFVAASSAGFHVVNISDPSAPILVATHTDDLDRPVSVDVLSDYAYALESSNDIVVFDVSNPVNPTIVNRVDPGRNRYSKLRVFAGRMYVGRESGSDLMIYDLGVPAAPVELWNEVAGYGAHVDFVVAGGTLYSAMGTQGLGLTDVTTPSAPQGISRSPGESYAGRVALWDTYAVTYLWASGLVVFDISDPAQPVELGRTSYIDCSGLAVRDGYAYCAGGGGLDIVDLTDPTTPVIIASTTARGGHVALTGDLAVVGGSSDGMRIVDVGDPFAPVEVATVDIDYAQVVAANGPGVYVPEYNTGLHIFDATVPSAPVEVGFIAIPDMGNNALAVGDDLLAVEDRGNGIRIYDVSSPLQPVETVFYTGLTRYRSFSISDHLLVVGGYYTERGLHVLDLSDPTHPVLLGDAPLIGDTPVDTAALGGLALVAEEDAGFEIFDLSVCALGTVVADFSWNPAQPWVGLTVEFTDASGGGVTGWSWTFGDGGTSTESDPSHVYAAAGTFSVELSVTGPTGTDSMTKNITVTQDPPETPPIEEAGARQWILPAAAHSPGAHGTNWVSDVVIHNPADQPASANVYFMKSGQSNSGIGGRLIEIPGETSVALNDVVFDLFGWSNASGAILIGSEMTLRIASRTYNDASSGTYGQFIPGLSVATAAATGEVVRLIQLTRSDTFRTNIGWANPGATSVNLAIDLVNAQGTSIGSHQALIPPFGYGQANDILPGNVDDAMAVVSTTTPGAKFFVYSSVVDNSTGDPILILESENAADLFIPASAHVQGLAGTDWRTDLEIANFKPQTVECTIDLLKTGFDNSTPKFAIVSVPANGNVRVRDVVDAMLDHDGSAALRLRSNGPKISATSSTFNTTSVGTFGQFISGTISDAAVTPARSGQMIQLSQSDGNTSGFRTNLGLLNVTGIQVFVQIELFDSAGTSVGTGSTVLLSYEHRQINRIFREVTSAAVTNGVARVSTTTPNGAFLAYASVVDNRSGDPVYIPAWVK